MKKIPKHRRNLVEHRAVDFGGEATIYISEQLGTSHEDGDEFQVEIALEAAHSIQEDRTVTVSYTGYPDLNGKMGVQSLFLPERHANRIGALLRQLQDRSGALDAIEVLEGADELHVPA